MEIIKGSEQHLESCLNIASQLPEYFTKKAISTMRTDLRDHDFYIAMARRGITGFISIQQKTESVAELLWLAVHPSYRREGVGSALIERVVTELKSEGFKTLEVKTLAEEVNYPPYESSRKFFEKVGFIHRKTIEHYHDWNPGNPCAIYVLIL